MNRCATSCRSVAAVLAVLIAGATACSGVPERTTKAEPVPVPASDENASQPTDEAAAADHRQQAEAALEQRDLAAAAREITLAAELSADPETAERAAQLTFGAGFDRLAEQAMRRWLELQPDNPLAHEALGRLLLRRQEVDLAAAEFTAALGDTEPRRDEVYLALAADLAAEDDARLVTRVLARLAAQDPLAPGLQLALSMAALRSGDAELALAAATAAGADDPEWLEPRLLSARAKVSLGRADEALADLEALARADPNPALDLEYARLLAASGRLDQAVTLVEGLMIGHGDRPEVVRALALLRMAAGDLDSAAADLERLSAAEDDRYEAFYLRAQIAQARGADEEARRLLRRIGSGPYLLPAQLGLAESTWRGGDGEAALEILSAFVSDHPAAAYEVLGMRARLLQSMNRHDEALTAYEAALQARPASIPLLLSRGALLERLGRVDESLEDLRRAARLAPDNPLALNAYGYTLGSHTRQLREAWNCVRTALEILPDSAAIQDSVGWVLFRMGRTDEARSYLEQAYAGMPDPEVASHLAEVSWRLGERSRAEGLLFAALAAHPDSDIAIATGERLLR